MVEKWTDFEDYFELLPADSGEHVARSQQLRYQVYCVEHHFLNPNDYPDQREIDQFDDRSVHTVLRHRQSGALVATVRLVLADEAEPDQHFPIERCEMLRRTIRDHDWIVPRHAVGEISRFAVSKEFRRRIKEAPTSHGLSASLAEGPTECPTRRFPFIAVGLFKAVLAMTARQNVTHWYAVMEPSLLRLLEQFGIKFTPIGPLVDFHGLRQPCIAVAEEVLSSLHQQRPEIWEFVTDSGKTTLSS